MKILELFSDKNVWIGPKGYPMIFLNGKNKMLHEYVWELENGPKPNGAIIHHKDMNKQNYSIENLQLCKNESEHKKIHARWIRNEDGEWIAKPCTSCGQILSLDEFYQRKGYSPCPMCKKCHIRQTNLYAKLNTKTKEYKREWYQKNKK